MPFGREDRWRNGRNLFTISLRHIQNSVQQIAKFGVSLLEICRSTGWVKPVGFGSGFGSG